MNIRMNVLFGYAQPALFLTESNDYNFHRRWVDYFINPYIKQKFPALNVEYDIYDEVCRLRTFDNSGNTLKQLLQFEEWYGNLPVFPWWKRFYLGWNQKITSTKSCIRLE